MKLDSQHEHKKAACQANGSRYCGNVGDCSGRIRFLVFQEGVSQFMLAADCVVSVAARVMEALAHSDYLVINGPGRADTAPQRPEGTVPFMI